jgi:hypothetical protein
MACGTVSASFAIEGAGVCRLAATGRAEAEQRLACIERHLANSEGS